MFASCRLPGVARTLLPRESWDVLRPCCYLLRLALHSSPERYCNLKLRYLDRPTRSAYLLNRVCDRGAKESFDVSTRGSSPPACMHTNEAPMLPVKPFPRRQTSSRNGNGRDLPIREHRPLFRLALRLHASPSHRSLSSRLHHFEMKPVDSHKHHPHPSSSIRFASDQSSSMSKTSRTVVPAPSSSSMSNDKGLTLMATMREEYTTYVD